MNSRNLWRVAVGSGAAALCLGVTTPIVAGGFGSEDLTDARDAAQATATRPDTAPFQTVRQQDAARTLAEQKALLERTLAGRTATLDRLTRKVLADGRLTAEQKAVFEQRAAKVRAALVRLRAAVADASSTEELNRILADAARAMPRVALPRLPPAPAVDVPVDAPVNAPVNVPVSVPVSVPAQPVPAGVLPAGRTGLRTLVVNDSTDHPRASRADADADAQRRDRTCEQRGDYDGRHRAADSERRDSRARDGTGHHRDDGRSYQRDRYDGR